MPRLVISTVGTSLLTNQIHQRRDPKGWEDMLQKTANLTEEQISQSEPDVLGIIQNLKQRTKEKLNKGNTLEIREASAELNGIYGLYNEQIEQGIPDTHLLVTTDTAQGQIAAKIVESFLNSKGLTNIITHAQSGLSTASSDIFVEGMAKLIPSIQETIKGYKNSRYTICFNLVGGFKALQGYFNTIGMFYADQIIYVFEGSNQLIKIPKLPVKVDMSEIEPYKVQLAMMEVGEISTSWEEAKKVPQEWILVDGQEMTLSAWGQLLWQQCKEELLSKEQPLPFPKLEYHQSFLNDYQAKPVNEKIILQKNLARAACLLKNHQDGISAMKQDGIFRLRRYVGRHQDIDHFDLPKDRRVSCIAQQGTLYLRHYGEHDYVNNNP